MRMAAMVLTSVVCAITLAGLQRQQTTRVQQPTVGTNGGGVSGSTPRLIEPPHTVPVQRTEVADWGSLLVNGRPVVVASLNKFVGWTGHGWLRNESDYQQRLREAKAAGFNSLWANWIPTGLWDAWSMWCTSNPHDLGRERVFNPHRVLQVANDPALLLWFLHSEFHGKTSNYEEWAKTKNHLKAIDPNHVVGDLVMIQVGYPSEALNPYWIMEYPMPEFTLSEFSPSTQVAHMINEAQYAQRMRERGARFVNAASVTVVSEFATFINGGRPIVPSREEIFRAFLLLAALNYRAFDVLWGANQVIYKNDQERQRLFQNLEEMRPAIDRAWKDTMDVFRLLTGPLYEALVDPANFVRVPSATPSFEQRGDHYVGVYAAQKSVGATTYLIAVNLEDNPIPVSIPVSGRTVTEILTGERLSVVSGLISTTLPARAARVYTLRTRYR